MANVEPLPREELEEFEPLFQSLEKSLGFVPNSFYTMGRRPEMLRAFTTLSGVVLRKGTVDPGLKQLVALMASASTGCRYCQAHTASGAAGAGVEEQRVESVFEFESSPLYSAAERAALRLARDAALVPNATSPEHFAALKSHYDDGEIVEVMGVISLFGWLNRWNDTVATDLEEEPLAFAQEHLGDAGWEPGKHR